MNVENMLSHDAPPRRRSDMITAESPQESYKSHQYSTRHAAQATPFTHDFQQYNTPQASPAYSLHPRESPDGYGHSPIKADPKHITFELLFNGDSRHRARLPMKVQIFPHDNTDGIVSTVKNFFGLYDETLGGVSFEDANGNTLIASYENFENSMTVYVKVSAGSVQTWQTHPEVLSHSDELPQLEEGFRMPPPHLNQSIHPYQSISRPASRSGRLQSTSPQLYGSQRAPSLPKIRARSGIKREGLENSFQQRLDDLNSEVIKGYNSSDGDAASATSSFRARNEHLASAEISEANIVEGGRRQKAKFESSELPLFVPPQVPAPHSISSVSPQRRSNGNEIVSPMANIYAGTSITYQPMPSPHSAGHSMNGYTNIAAKAPMPAHGHRLRDRASTPSITTQMRGAFGSRTSGFGILPTPDPTIASTISDEDVALQLMRLGDPANMSHGRTSASTMDDAFSGRACASSVSDEDEHDSDAENEAARQARNAQIATSVAHRKRTASDALSDLSGDDEFNSEMPHAKRPKTSMPKPASAHARPGVAIKKNTKPPKPRNIMPNKKPKLVQGSMTTKIPISPASLPPQSRKGSVASLMGPPQLPFSDEPDLSTKPRCQRCRKSKKGCDRQRPCQRCMDAGIGIEGCVSEDEGNGRKGRFGRHMGVTIQTEKSGATTSIEGSESMTGVEDLTNDLDKNKKRKR